MPDRGLRRALGFRDLLLFYIATTFSLRWMATAAASGPSALVIWLIGAVGLFVPLVFTTIELSTRFPQEGGIYVWSREVFGPFAGFMTGWIYWCSNLSYLPSLLYFAAGNILFVAGGSLQALSSSPGYFIAASLLGLGVAAYVNVIGLNVGKWLNNAGGVASWIVAAALIGFGAIAFARFGSATEMTASSFVPSTGLKEVIFWSTIAFAYSGVESASTMAEEIENPRRTVPRAVLAAAASITLLYLAGTFSILVAVPPEQVSGIQGILQALEAMTARVGAGWAIVPLAVLVFVSTVGGVSGWFAAVGRLPFVAGIDRFLPAAFGRVHPTWRTPHVALLAQAAVSAVVVVLGQAGTTVRGAYDVLVSMSIIGAFIPFLFMFAAVIRVQDVPQRVADLKVRGYTAEKVRGDTAEKVRGEMAKKVRGYTAEKVRGDNAEKVRGDNAGAPRMPGGRSTARLLGTMGLATTVVAIALACVPPADEPHPLLAVTKIVGLSLSMAAAGAGVYAAGRR